MNAIRQEDRRVLRRGAEKSTGTMKTSTGNRVLMLLENTCFPRDARVSLEAATLVNAGYHVTVISPASPDQRWHEILDGVSVYRYPGPCSGGGVLGYVWEYGISIAATFLLSLWVFVRHGFDVVHAHSPPDLFVFVAVFYKVFGKRFVYDHHDLSPEMYLARAGGNGNRLMYRALVLFEKLSCRLADHVIATNHSYKTMEMQRARVPEERITVVRNGPDLERLVHVAPDESLRRNGTKIIGYLGNMGMQDGIDCLLRSLKHLKEDFGRTDFYCILMGDGDALQSSIQLATELDLDDNLCFAGYARGATLLRYLSTMDVGVCPDPSSAYSDRSTMIKVMEYMAMRKPTVAFDLPENRVTARSAALYARPNNERDFARQIVTLMDDPQRCARMGRLGRQRIENELAWSCQEQYLLRAYRKLATRPEPRTIDKTPSRQTQ